MLMGDEIGFKKAAEAIRDGRIRDSLAQNLAIWVAYKEWEGLSTESTKKADERYGTPTTATALKAYHDYETQVHARLEAEFIKELGITQDSLTALSMHVFKSQWPARRQQILHPGKR
jgi:hypothetical protein